MLIAMTFIDIDKMLLPDELTLPLLWLGLIISLGEVFVTPADAIIGAGRRISITLVSLLGALNY